MAAESMFNAVELRHASAGGSPSEKVAIRFSWYQIVHEELRDVLLSATSESQQQKLFMREDPAGNGIVVPNLWEVEVKTAEDLRELVARVRSNFAKKNQKAIQDPHAHNVLCLNLVEVPVTGYNEKKSPRQPRVGRLNFIALANATAPLPKKLPSTNSSVHRDIEDSSGVSAWVRALHEALTALESSQPSPPFRRSRVSLLLRDAILSRSPSTLLSVLSPDIEAAAYSSATLKFCARMRSASRIAAGEEPSPSSRPAGSFLSRTSPHVEDESYGASLVASTLHRGDSIMEGYGGEPASHSPTGSPSHPLSMPMAMQRRLASSPRSRGDQGGNGGSLRQSGPPPSGSGAAMGSSPPPPSSPIRSPYQGRGQAQEYHGGGLRPHSPSDTSSKPHPHLSSGATMSRMDGVGAEGEMDGVDPLAQAQQVAERMAKLSEEGDESARWFTAMLSALEVSRDETKALRERLGVVTAQLNEVMQERDALRRQLGAAQATGEAERAANALLDDQRVSGLELGRMEARHNQTIREMRSQLRVTRQEVKDYELYKNVMETAVCKLQAEIARITEEREAAKKQLRQAHTSARRERDSMLQWKRKALQLEKDLDAVQEEMEEMVARSHRNREQAARDAVRQREVSARLAAGIPTGGAGAERRRRELMAEEGDVSEDVTEEEPSHNSTIGQRKKGQRGSPQRPQRPVTTTSGSQDQQQTLEQRSMAMVSNFVDSVLTPKRSRRGGTEGGEEEEGKATDASYASYLSGNSGSDSDLMRAAANMAKDVEELMKGGGGGGSLLGAGSRAAARLSSDTPGSRASRPVARNGRPGLRGEGRTEGGKGARGAASARGGGGREGEAGAVTGRTKGHQQIAAFARARALARGSDPSDRSQPDQKAESEGPPSSRHQALIQGLRQEMEVARRQRK